mmetsp:Transcript_66166/g.154982  ORF Transcript_66166/g.154982 Transcript_66166/m.154982 type:complete len:247 (-) Transcript_66166:79-819(-)
MATADFGACDETYNRCPEARQRSVERLIAESVQASMTAENRALKRRVRQRLHKRLGAMLPAEEFEEAVLRFKLLEVEHSNKGSPEAAQSNAPQEVCPENIQFSPVPMAGYMNPWAMDSNYVIAPWVQSIPGSFGGPVWNVWDTAEYEYEIWQPQLTNSMPRRKKFTKEQVESGSTSTREAAEDSSASASAEDSPPSSVEAVSTSNLELEDECDELPCFDHERLPVVRTFLHFDTRPPCQHRRSKSI